MQNGPSIVSILWRYQQKEKLRPEELEILRLWLLDSPKNQLLFDELSNEEVWNREMQLLRKKGPDVIWNMIQMRVDGFKPVIETRFSKWKSGVAAAAIAIGFLAVSGYYYFRDVINAGKPGIAQSEESYKNDFQPGGMKAILTMADGSKIELDSIQHKILAGKESTSLIELNAGKLNYTFNSEIAAPLQYNVLTTPVGGMFEISLSDGSRIWLNADSKLTYPVSFTTAERVVELSGEAYFEVAKNSGKPFLVKTENGEVKVLGTVFNVNAYTNENTVQTTLIEGAVLMRSKADSLLLKPGQRADIDKPGKITAGAVNVQQMIAWRKSIFWFQNDSYETILRQLARWYKVQVVFKDSIEPKFSGILPRNLPLSKLLKILEKAGHVHFSIEGETVIVRH